ncbi:MAG: response regulator [Spirochaetes bacterium]|nr:response regulator [Spirochaetota bacterium]
MKKNKSKKILVIDDEPSMHEVILKQLKNENFEITTSCDPKEALKLINMKDFDVVLCDIFMNNLSGIEVLKKVKFNRPDVKIILMTGYYDTDLEVEAKKYGSTDFLTKPIKKTDLINALNTQKHIF